jgi:hypothetical protein
MQLGVVRFGLVCGILFVGNIGTSNNAITRHLDFGKEKAMLSRTISRIQKIVCSLASSNDDSSGPAGETHSPEMVNGENVRALEELIAELKEIAIDIEILGDVEIILANANNSALDIVFGKETANHCEKTLRDWFMDYISPETIDGKPHFKKYVKSYLTRNRRFVSEKIASLLKNGLDLDGAFEKLASNVMKWKFLSETEVISETEVFCETVVQFNDKVLGETGC